MRAGSLRYILQMIVYRKTQSPSGFMSESETVLYIARAQKLRQLQRWDKDGIEAKERFDGETLKFRVRNDKRLSKVEYVRFNGVLFRITLKDLNVLDDTVIISCMKKDE